MSAIGSYAVLDRAQFQRCLDAARGIRPETTGKWLFKRTETVGAPEFMATWHASVRKDVRFGYSGYVLGNYVDAQREINQAQLADEESEVARALGRAFTAVFVFDAPVALPDLPQAKLEAYCRDEYGDEGTELLEPITAAHGFFAQGLAEITPDALVVFIIS